MFNQHDRIDFIFFRSGPNIQVGKTEEPFILALISCDVRNWYWKRGIPNAGYAYSWDISHESHESKNMIHFTHFENLMCYESSLRWTLPTSNFLRWMPPLEAAGQWPSQTTSLCSPSSTSRGPSSSFKSSISSDMTLFCCKINKLSWTRGLVPK